jgi:hypothetical protein
MRYKHPWGTKPDASTILLLPGFERGFLNADGGAYLRDAMGQVPMQTLAVGGESALGVGVLPPGGFVSLALFPTQAAFFDLTVFIIIVGIIGATLPVHLTLHLSLFAGRGRQVFAERDQIGSSLLGHNCQRGWADIQADDVFAHFLMPGLDERVAL